MGIEIERKFKVKNNSWKKGIKGEIYRQGYISTKKDRTVRIRQSGNRAWMTVKGISQGFSRLEFEYEIPKEDACEMLDELCETPLIEKTRYKIFHKGHTWEVDEFHGVNKGLIIAEIELSDEGEKFDLPGWIGEEVTGDVNYFNSSLVKHPFCEW